MKTIPFNKPFIIGKETEYINEAVDRGQISGNGKYTHLCHNFFTSKYGFRKALLTSSCTDALEMAAILLDITKGDEVIMPSFTFVSTANAFVLRGAKIVFADSESNTPNIDTETLEALITPRTKAIVVVHYAGIACNMNKVMELAQKYNLFVVEDAAQAIDSYFQGKALGSIGHLAAFSFHETKNIISGEGGMLVVNDERFIKRAEIIWEKGTNRSAFFRGEVDKYGWVDIGSSFLPSDIIAAFLYAQIENIGKIQSKRNVIWYQYKEQLQKLESKNYIKLPHIPIYASNNAHLFYILCNSLQERTDLINFLREKKIVAVFHYLPLHKSPFYEPFHDGRELPYSQQYADTLLRLPLYYELEAEDQQRVIDAIKSFFLK